MIRKATVDDSKQIQSLINFYAAKNLMLSRSLNEIYENIRDYWIFEERKKISKSKLPHKIWIECCKCPKFPRCQEEALIKRI